MGMDMGTAHGDMGHQRVCPYVGSLGLSGSLSPLFCLPHLCQHTHQASRLIPKPIAKETRETPTI